MIHEHGIPRVARPLRHLYLINRPDLRPGDKALCGHLRTPCGGPPAEDVVGEWTVPDQCLVCADLAVLGESVL